MDCIICQKHRDFLKCTGQPIAERGGLYLSHFPVLDGVPANRGHLLIETRRHIVDPGDLSDTEASAIGLLVRVGIKALRTLLHAEHAYVLRINDKTPHFHFHIVPRYAQTPTEHWGPNLMNWKDFPKIGLQEVQALADDLRRQMR